MIVEKLQSFNFTKMEASVYLTLVKYSQLNGSQIAKIINASRTSVYSALESLYRKGAVFLLPGESNTSSYRAQRPEILIEKLEKEYTENVDYLKKEFAKLRNRDEDDEEYMNIRGHQNFVMKTKELLLEAEKEVYLNTNYDLQVFREEFLELNKRGVRIILFSFEMPVLDGIEVELYFNPILGTDFNEEFERFMVVVDCKKVLLASRRQNEDFIGTFTSNPFLVYIVSDHIHHDIYLLKLETKYQIQKSWFDNNIQVKTIREQIFEEHFNKQKEKGG